MQAAVKRRVALLFVVTAALLPGTILAQQKDEARALMDRAQSEAERRAVRDMMSKLLLPASPKPAEKPPASSPPAAAGEAAAPAAQPQPSAPAATATVATTGPVEPPAQPPTAASAEPPAPAVQAPQQEVSATATDATDVAPQTATISTPTADPNLDRAPAIAMTEKLPTDEIQVFFGFGSADITADAVAKLNILGRVLSDPSAAGQTFVICGFTDGKGKFDYNMRLSQLRADAVRQFLTTRFAIDPNRLISKGYGKTQFRDKAHPQASENRRVQVINWSGKVGPTP